MHPVAATGLLLRAELLWIQWVEAVDGLRVKALETHQRISVSEVLRMEISEDDRLCAIRGYVFGCSAFAGDTGLRWSNEPVLEPLLHGWPNGLVERDHVLRCCHVF